MMSRNEAAALVASQVPELVPVVTSAVLSEKGFHLVRNAWGTHPITIQ